MAQPYVGEIRMFAGNFAPVGWMFCQGQLVAISENDTLFNLIGTTYGGDGQETFQLPDLQGRLPMHQGNGTFMGEKGGVETVTLTTQTMPSHPHTLFCTANTASTTSPEQNVLASSTDANTLPYNTDAPLTNLLPALLGPAGGSQAHENMQPYLVVNFIISMFGIFPSQT